MNMFKKNGGFTLVELIVVIAILAILAGVAIPAYSGYITKAKDASAITELDALATAVQAANSTGGEINKIELAPVAGENATGYTVAVSAATMAKDFYDNFAMFYEGETITTANDTTTITIDADLKGTSYEAGATWENGEWTK